MAPFSKIVVKAFGFDAGIWKSILHNVVAARANLAKPYDPMVEPAKSTELNGSDGRSTYDVRTTSDPVGFVSKPVTFVEC